MQNHKAKLIPEGKRNTYAGMQLAVDAHKFSVLCKKADFTDTTPFFLEFEDNVLGSIPTVDGDKENLAVIITTKQWLKVFGLGERTHFGGCFSLDGKEGVIWNKFPVTPLIVIDADGKGHFAALCIASHNSETWIRLMCEAVYSVAKTFQPHISSLKYGKSDGADAFGNVGVKLDWVTNWGNCYMHLIVCNLTRKGATLHRLVKDDVEVQKIKVYLKCISSVYTVEMKLHLLRSFLNLLFPDFPEFCVRFVIEYAPDVLLHLQHLFSTKKAARFLAAKKELPDFIADRYLWKGKWTCADNEDVGVPLTQCSAEGEYIICAAATFLAKLVFQKKNNLFLRNILITQISIFEIMTDYLLQ